LRTICSYAGHACPHRHDPTRRRHPLRQVLLVASMRRKQERQSRRSSSDSPHSGVDRLVLSNEWKLRPILSPPSPARPLDDIPASREKKLGPATEISASLPGPRLPMMAPIGTEQRPASARRVGVRIQWLGAVIGSLERGKLADIVLWRPKFFGVKPERSSKGGVPGDGSTGVASASFVTQNQSITPAVGGCGTAPPRLVALVTSQLAYEQNLRRGCRRRRRVVPVRARVYCVKQHMVRNAALRW